MGRIIEVTFLLIAGGLILGHASEFGTAMGAVSTTYVNAVQALQGR